MAETLGQLVRRYRTERGMSQREAARALDISPQYLCDIEQDRRGDSVRVLKWLHKETGISRAALLATVWPEDA